MRGVSQRALLLDGPRSEIEHHHHEHEQHHDGAGIDDDFERRDEGRAEREEHQRHRQQRDDQIEQRMHAFSLVITSAVATMATTAAAIEGR